MRPDDTARPEGEPPPAPAQSPASQPPAPLPPRRADGEGLAGQLRDSLRRRRPSRLAIALLLLLVAAVPVVLFLWLYQPGAGEVPLVVTAFDRVAVQGEPVQCRARLVPADPAHVGANVAGHQLQFEQTGAGGAAGQAKTTTGPDGVVSVTWREPPQTPFEFVVRYVAPDRRSEATDRARVFPWPRATRILLVDVATLTAAGEKLWAQEQLAPAPLLPGTAEALEAARKANFAIVYVAVAPERAAVYHQVRNWVERETVGPGKRIPDGPVLGRLSLPRVVGGQEAHVQLAAVLREFDGPNAVLVRRPETGAAYRAAGVKTLTVGPDGLTWGKVGKELPR